MNDKIKILAYGDYACATGFGRVMSEIMQELNKTGRYEIDVVGINYSGDPFDREKWPGNVWPALSALNMQGPYADVYGRQRLLDRLSTGEYDVLFMLQDTFIVQAFMKQILQAQEKLARKFKIVYYFPFDSTPKHEWVMDVVAKVDYPVTYTHYAHNEIEKIDPGTAERTQVIYHGTNAQDFNYIEDRDWVAKFRKEWFQGSADGKFLLVNVNRNQARKDIARNFMVLKELRDRGIDDVVLYLHMQHDDVGGNILVMAENYGLQIEKDFICPHPQAFNANQGFPTEVVNAIYNAADAVITTTLGEGWGLSVTEAMATRTPVIAPNHTSLKEILADQRGALVPAGNDPSLWITKEMDNERVRPLMDVWAAADRVIELKAGTSNIDLDAAYAFAQQWSWTNVVSQWLPIIDRAGQEARESSAPQPNREQRRQKRK